jgi:predicted transcriptional regulator
MRGASTSASAVDRVSDDETIPVGGREELALLRFGPLEGRVMHTLWSFDEITLADLHHLLADTAISQSVLRSTLEKLHLKRLIRSRKVHRTCFYRAAFDQATFIRLLSVQLAGFLGEAGMVVLKNASEG